MQSSFEAVLTAREVSSRAVHLLHIYYRIARYDYERIGVGLAQLHPVVCFDLGDVVRQGRVASPLGTHGDSAATACRARRECAVIVVAACEVGTCTRCRGAERGPLLRIGGRGVVHASGEQQSAYDRGSAHATLPPGIWFLVATASPAPWMAQRAENTTAV